MAHRTSRPDPPWSSLCGHEHTVGRVRIRWRVVVAEVCATAASYSYTAAVYIFPVLSVFRSGSQLCSAAVVAVCLRDTVLGCCRTTMATYDPSMSYGRRKRSRL